ncbi:hypothetical protein Tco_0937120 [Tanacetum coccineum]|uniref:Uncharacterized protein n=1 Tax=Tanacetum coccineum TaxID=301880 RepID=A0ABQ5DE61_9ASTR
MLSKPIHLSETEESGISCVGVKSVNIRRNAKSEGSSLGPYRRWGAKAWGANRIRYPGSPCRAAWLSSARVVRCLVKSYNERNPRDDDVKLTAEKDWAFRRAARWTASDILEEGGDDVKSAWPLWAGPHTCYNGNYNGKQGCKAERIRKDCLSSDCSLQLGNMKLESLVIADQHAAVNMYPGPVHTARHTLGIGFARSIGPMITHDFCVPLVPQRLLVVLLAHTTVGSSTGVKS